jgi:hypothetical protein
MVFIEKRNKKRRMVVECASYASYSTDDEQLTKQKQVKNHSNQNVEGIYVNENSHLKLNFDPTPKILASVPFSTEKPTPNPKNPPKKQKSAHLRTLESSKTQEPNPSSDFAKSKPLPNPSKNPEPLKKPEIFPSKFLKILNLEGNNEKSYVFSLFLETKRILSIKFEKELLNGTLSHFCLLGFSSQSSARKTLSGYKNWHKHQVHWVSSTGVFISDAHYAQQKINFYRQVGPTFNYSLFERDPIQFIYPMAVDSSCPVIVYGDLFNGNQGILCNELIEAIN